MLFLDGVYVEGPDGSLRFRWVKAPTSAELARLTKTLALRIGRDLERRGLLERDAENSYLARDDLVAGPMEQLQGSSITYRIAVGPHAGRKVFTLQTLPACEEPFDAGGSARWPANIPAQPFELLALTCAGRHARNTPTSSVSSFVCGTHDSPQNERSEPPRVRRRADVSTSRSAGTGAFQGRPVMCFGATAWGVERPRSLPRKRASGWTTWSHAMSAR